MMIIYSFISLEKNQIMIFLKSCWFKRLLLEQFRKLFKYDGVKNAASPPSSILVMRKISKINPD